jgi:hypothetical protein
MNVCIPLNHSGSPTLHIFTLYLTKNVEKFEPIAIGAAAAAEKIPFVWARKKCSLNNNCGRFPWTS